MKKIIFLHGFFASGSCLPALTLKEALQGKAEVLTPDLPMDPTEAWTFIHDLCDRERPDLLVGNSCGSFYAQMLAPIVGVYYIDKVWGLFGEKAFWVRPEKMFFEKVTRDGRTFNRFLETEI
jgi:predicted esterase YcpF (UPF0227 family)